MTSVDLNQSKLSPLPSLNTLASVYKCLCICVQRPELISDTNLKSITFYFVLKSIIILCIIFNVSVGGMCGV